MDRHVRFADNVVKNPRSGVPDYVPPTEGMSVRQREAIERLDCSAAGVDVHYRIEYPLAAPARFCLAILRAEYTTAIQKPRNLERVDRQSSRLNCCNRFCDDRIGEVGRSYA